MRHRRYQRLVATTEDGVPMVKGQLYWYVNYLGYVMPRVFNLRPKSKIVYFSSREKAVRFARKHTMESFLLFVHNK